MSGMLKEEDVTSKIVIEVAERMMLAARTAPKGKGKGNLVIMIAIESDIKKISDHMRGIGEKYDLSIFIRDAENIYASLAMLLIGSRIEPMGLKHCGMCGFGSCDNKRNYPNVPCVFNTGDMGIAIGSAVSIAADARVDSRVMYTVGQAAIDMNILGEDIKIAYGIPLSATSKNPFFDRK